MNKEVSPELAKLLKEKGFDYHLLYNDFANEYDYFDRSVQGRIHVSDFPEDKFPDENKWIPVPYIHQVVMWLYEKHGIWINVYYKPKYKSWDYEYTNTNWSQEEVDKKLKEDIDNLLEDIFNAKIKYNSPTEAYEAAIEHTLKNLIK